MRKMGIRGTINIFVALMMIPTIAFTGLMVDFARLQMASVQVNNAADLAAASAIAYYDGLLQDVYGLYATSQDDKARQEFSEEYARAALGLDESGKKAVSSLNLFSTGKTTNPLTVEVITPSEYSLKNTAYLRYEIAQYMKYRVAFSLADAVSIVEDMQSSFTDTEKSTNMAENEQTFVDNDYKEICDEIENIRNLYRELHSDIAKAQNGIGKFNTDTTNSLREIQDIYDQLDREIRDEYYLNTSLLYDEVRDNAENIKEDIEDYKSLFDSIKSKADEIESRTNALNSKIDAAKNKLSIGKGTAYSGSFADSVISQLEKDRQKLVSGLGDASGNFQNSNNSKLDNVKYGSYTIDNSVGGTVLNDVMTNAVNFGGSGMYTLVVTGDPAVNISITPFDSSKYEELRKAIDSNGAIYTQERVEEFNEQANRAAEVPHDVPNLTGVRIPSNYLSETGDWMDSSTEDGFLEEVTLNRILLVEYGVQMFSNYVTNRRLKDGEFIDDRTLSGVPFTTKMNYMYGAELEYIYWGSNNARTNYNAVIATLSVMFASRNLAFTFMDDSIKGEIEAIRLIPYVGWALAEAYRASIVAIETWRDIDTLIDGKKVPLVKETNMTSKCEWRSSLYYTAMDAMGQSAWGPWGGKGEGTGMYYYEYLRLLILFNFFASNDKIARRISTLIELNMNNYMYGNNGCVNKELTDLKKFKMNKAFVNVDVKLTGSIPYFFISMPFLAQKASGFNTNRMSFEITKSRSY